MKTKQDGKEKTFLGGKGFYLALTLSLAAIGLAAWLGISSTLKELENDGENEILPPKVITEDEWQNSPTDNKQKDVPKENPAEKDGGKKPEEPADAELQGFILPLKGEVVNPYSGDKVVKSKTLDEWVMHTGVDLGAEVGTPVKAICKGTVVEVKNDDMWGTCVTVEHSNGITSHYMNLKSATNVKVNQAVKSGDVIGSVGETCKIEKAEKSHLHFGVKQNGEWIDPMSICK